MKNLFYLLITIIMLSSCFQRKSIEAYDIGPMLNSSLNKLQNQDTVRFNFCEMNEFEWEDLIIVPPYATMEYLDSFNILNKKDVKNVMKAVESNDFRTIYLFINKDSIVRYQIFEHKDYAISLNTVNFETPRRRYSKQVLCNKLYIEKIDGKTFFRM